ncbi:hypothetical protein BACCIP111895_03136 [Neobacillus rhizosphaerae]|uniref:Uncharacterized protein n=1 Tax=Neobacillus rhizosphaerae TaxID=2880965 RepID=A0ABM9ETH2_9BACI|nr:hypothetical protein [Neobacillus rhizosphaerae]CAH2715952.1 hypothetical protein BACCIP111895_03136 [Neobacillus rhizosphaerae]
MKKDLLEYIKVASFVIIAISLSVIAWNSSKEISYLQEIEDQLGNIKVALNTHLER